MRYRVATIIIALLFCCLIPLQAFPAGPKSKAAANRDNEAIVDPDLEEFMKERDRELGEFKADKAREVQAFKDDADREFTEFLKDAWEEFGLEAPVPVIKKPKPVATPVFAPQPPKTAAAPKAPLKIVIAKPVAPEPPPVPKPVVQAIPGPTEKPPPAPPATPIITKPSPPPTPPVEAPKKAEIPPGPVAQKPAGPPPSPVKPEPPAALPLPAPPVKVAAITGPAANFSYFGRDLALLYDPRMNTKAARPINNTNISDYWQAMALSDFDLLVNRTKALREELQLNDWGYLLLLDMLGRQVNTDPTVTDRNLFIWFMLTKSGYDAKVGFHDNDVAILLPVTGRLYGRNFFTMDGKRYYVLSASHNEETMEKIFTFRASYPGAERTMDFSIRTYPELPEKATEKKLVFSYGDQTYTVHVRINGNSIPYFEFYPQTDVAVYASAPAPASMGNSLLTDLKPIVAGKSEAEALNLLLRFTQTAFQYQTDQQQFKREKFLFPEETVFYPYSDCEDRSILFSYLVKNLLGLEVILLHYPNHIATAVLLKGQPVGDQVIVADKSYTICDPTYINANIGWAMPQFANVTPEVIFF